MTPLTERTLPTLIGQDLGPGDWLTISQEMINGFAVSTGDDYWVHIDVERAAKGPFGHTIAHGLLTLSLIAQLEKSVVCFDGFGLGVHYGYKRVRFPAVVPVNSRLRLWACVLEFKPVESMWQTIVEYRIERESCSKPACVAEMIFRHQK